MCLCMQAQKLQKRLASTEAKCAEMEKKLKSVTSSGSGVTIDPLPANLNGNANANVNVNSSIDKETIKSLNATIESHVASIKALTEAKAKSEGELHAMRSKSNDDGHSVVELSFKLSQTESELSSLQSLLKQRSDELTQQKSIVEKLAREHITVKKAAKNDQSTIEALRKQIDTLNANAANNNANASTSPPPPPPSSPSKADLTAAISAATEPLRREIDTLRAEVRSKDDELTSVKAANAAAVSTNSANISAASAATTTIAQLKSEITSLSAALSTAESERSSATKSVASLQKQIDTLNEGFTSRNSDLDKAQKLIDTLRSEKQTLRDAIKSKDDELITVTNAMAAATASVTGGKTETTAIIESLKKQTEQLEASISTSVMHHSVSLWLSSILTEDCIVFSDLRASEAKAEESVTAATAAAQTATEAAVKRRDDEWTVKWNESDKRRTKLEADNSALQTQLNTIRSQFSEVDDLAKSVQLQHIKEKEDLNVKLTKAVKQLQSQREKINAAAQQTTDLERIRNEQKLKIDEVFHSHLVSQCIDYVHTSLICCPCLPANSWNARLQPFPNSSQPRTTFACGASMD